jgi:hypothetical protein
MVHKVILKHYSRHVIQYSWFLGQDSELEYSECEMRQMIHRAMYGLIPRANYTDRATTACRRS